MDLDAALAPFTVPEVERVFVLGALERNVSICLQQIRALNLAWLLHQRGLVAGRRWHIVGGGFAGLTVAAAAARLGARVVLHEKGRELLGLQRRNRTRYIHPHIHQWPRPGARATDAGLPLLSWHAGLAGDMATEVLDGFEREASARHIETRLSAPPLDLEAALADDAAIVVLALGLGVERSFGALPLGSYWLDDDIARYQPGARTRHLVSGVGEGGVIDALYLTLRDFSHARIADALAGLPETAAVAAQLLDCEASLAGLDDDAAGARLTTRYAAVTAPGADAVLSQLRRDDTEVLLNGPEAGPLSPKADILNRFLISRLIGLGAITYVPGTITDIAARPGGFDVQLDHTRVTPVDRVHLRHGTVPALKQAYPALWARYQPHRMRLPFVAPTPLFPPDAFSG